MTQRRRRTLIWRLYAFAVIELVLIIGITTARLRLSTTPLPSQALVERVANYLATEVALVRDNPIALEQELARVKSEMNASAALYDRDGKLVMSNTNPPPQLVSANKGTEGKRAGEVTTGAVVRTAAHGDETLSLLVAPLPRPERNDAFTLAIVLLIVALPALLFAREMAVPLARLAEAARGLGGGDLKVRTGIRRRDELGEVAEAFDEMASRLEQLIRAQRELLANVSHELRTPLARIKVALDIAAEGDSEAARESLKDIGQDLAELERLIEDVLATSRLDAGADSALPPLRTENVRVSELLKQSAARFSTAHKQKLDVEVEDGLPELRLDPSLFRRAIDNLLDNAGKYSEASSVVKLRARREGGKVIISVNDRGIGVDAADLPQLFTPFFRTDRSRARKTGGVGLGLALARRIVQAHGGELSLTSNETEGTTARVELSAA